MKLKRKYYVSILVRKIAHCRCVMVFCVRQVAERMKRELALNCFTEKYWTIIFVKQQKGHKTFQINFTTLLVIRVTTMRCILIWAVDKNQSTCVYISCCVLFVWLIKWLEIQSVKLKQLHKINIFYFILVIVKRRDRKNTKTDVNVI